MSDETRKRLSNAGRKRFSDSNQRILQGIRLKESRRKYRIAKCDLNGKIIKIYEIIADIIDENPTYYKQAIKGCCQGTKRSYKGYKWHYCSLKSKDLILKGMFDKL